jgi:hypothetical protein
MNSNLSSVFGSKPHLSRVRSQFPFLGFHFTRMIDGRVHAGPNAVLSLRGKDIIVARSTLPTS